MNACIIILFFGALLQSLPLQLGGEGRPGGASPCQTPIWGFPFSWIAEIPTPPPPSWHPLLMVGNPSFFPSHCPPMQQESSICKQQWWRGRGAELGWGVSLPSPLPGASSLLHRNASCCIASGSQWDSRWGFLPAWCSSADCTQRKEGACWNPEHSSSRKGRPGLERPPGEAFGDDPSGRGSELVGGKLVVSVLGVLFERGVHCEFLEMQRFGVCNAPGRDLFLG